MNRAPGLMRRNWLALMGAPLVAWGGLPRFAWAGCAPLPAPVVDVQATGYYTDAWHSEVSAELQARNRESTAEGRRFLAEVSRAADRFHGAQDEAAAHCALVGLQQWANGGALLGQMQGPLHGQQAEYERKWLLAGLTLAYLKLKPAAGAAQRAEIEAWLMQLADAVWRFWEDASGQATRHRRNNHYTWAGLTQAATALATGDAPRWARAHRVFTDTLGEIDAHGRLPMEMARGRRALHYHAFTAGPLMVMVALSRARGEDWLAPSDARARLQRLVDAVLEGLAEPRGFAGEPQELPTPATLAWLALWQKDDRQPERITRWLANAPGVPTLGGDLRLMAQRSW